MERGAVGWIDLLVDSLGPGTLTNLKWFVIDIMYLKMRKAECWSENDSFGE